MINPLRQHHQQDWRITTPSKGKPSGQSHAPGDHFNSGGSAAQGDWKSTLAQFGEILKTREALGFDDAKQNAENAANLARIQADVTPTTDLKVIADRRMAKAGLLPSFPSVVLEQVNGVKSAPGMEPGVVDLRDLPVVSVDNGKLDPVTHKLDKESKDIDQCQWSEKLPNGNIRNLVFIADVDSLVKKGDACDRQAMHNGATVYTDDKIFPMIPESFSTDFTSLNGHEDRLAVVKENQVTPDGQVVEPKVYRAYINNHAKMAYESVNEWQTGGNGPKPPQLEDPQIAEQISLQDESAQRLRSFFYGQGSLDIESSEVRADIKDGQVVGMEVEVQSRAKDMIKYNMMAANMASMQTLEAAGVPHLRRIVKTPEKWDQIVELAKSLECELPTTPDAKALNHFLETRKAADPSRQEQLCEKVVKLVGRGEYVVWNKDEPVEGHFCLSVHDYGHTTAPNRRAPDLINQRIEKAVAEGKPCPYTTEELEELALHQSGQEKAIQGVERDVHKSASAKLMADKVGQSFNAKVMQSTEIGSFIKLNDPPVRGVMRDCKTEEGKDIRVTLDKVNVEKGWIDFVPEGTITARGGDQVVDGFLLKA